MNIIYLDCHAINIENMQCHEKGEDWTDNKESDDKESAKE